MAPRTLSPGRLVHRPDGYMAFLPDPLPPRLEWTPELTLALSEADRALGRLAGEGRKLPNPHLLFRPFVGREAVLSSRIEGTQATLGELLTKEAGGVVERSSGELREVGNYVAALEFGIGELSKGHGGHITLDLVRELHLRLMRGLPNERAKPGEFRRTQNWIGHAGCTVWTASYVPPPPEELERLLLAWEAFLQDRTLPPLIQIALAHYQFEAIHPFLDGNGRVGRLLIILFIIRSDLLPVPLLYLSAFFEATRWDYYQHLREVTEGGRWQEWLLYFLNGVARQAEDAVSRAERINSLLECWRKAVAGSASKTPEALVELLAENPFWTTKRAARRLGVAYTTAQRAIKKLVDQSILTQTSDAGRNRVYCARPILAILEEPAKIASFEES